MMMWLMCLLDLITMSKRFKYLISSILSALGFFMFVGLPYESRYFGLMAGMVLVMFCFWFGLGIVFTDDFDLRMMSVILPTFFFAGFGLFIALIPYSFASAVFFSLVFGVVYYVLFLVENVFMVAIGYKTVPLYRAAYTVSLIILLLTAFFMFDTLFSFRLFFVWNVLGVAIISAIIFLYQFWAVAIELSDDGKGKDRRGFVLWPTVVLTEISLCLSFLPTGIFKGSVYLVAIIYILSGLIQAEIRDRLFKRTYMMYVWTMVALVLAILLATRWR